MREDKDLEKLFADTFSDFEAAPPAHLKAGIDQAISVAPGRKKWWLLLLTCVVIVAGAAIWFLVPSKEANLITSKNQIGNADSAHDLHTNSADHNREQTHTRKTSNSSGEVTGVDQNVHGATTTSVSDAQAERNFNPPVNAESSSKSALKVKGKSKKSTSKRTKRAQPNDLPTNGSTTLPGSTVGENANLAQSGSGSSSSEVISTKTDSLSTLPADSLSTAQTDTSESNPADVSAIDSPENHAHHWLGQLQPGIGFSSAYKASYDITGKVGFNVFAGIYRQFGTAENFRAGLDLGYASGSYSWEKSTTNLISYEADSIYTYYNQADSTFYTDTIYYTVYQSQTTKNPASADYTQLIIGLSAQYDIPFTKKMGLVTSPAVRFASTKFLRSTDGNSYTSSAVQVGLGLDVYYNINRWRFSLGGAYTQTWLRKTDNPFQATGLGVFSPRVGIGFRF